MKQLKQLNDRIISRVNVVLEEFDFNTDGFVTETMDYENMLKFYAFYGITSRHPIYFQFKNSNIAGSYFLGKCYVGRSAVYKSDIRGDELKRRGDDVGSEKNIPLVKDESITIRDSLLYRTLVHSNSHNPGIPEEFSIRNTISAHYANIHGSTLQGCFLGPFATVDLMNLYACIIGEFSYVQAGELFHRKIEPGTIWVRSNSFDFKYKYDKEMLNHYVGVNAFHKPQGIIYEFVKERAQDYEKLFDVMHLEPIDAPSNSAVNRYAVVKGKTNIGENVLVSQRAYLDNAVMGDGSNAQENTFIVHSTLAGLNVTAHGGKILHSDIGKETFVGFNSFINGKPEARIEIGERCIVMPHTIIDPDVAIKIPREHLIWGGITCEDDIKTHTMSLDDFAEIRDEMHLGNMVFTGKGSVFVDAFRRRIQHILEANGALYKKGENRGHAQDDQRISFNIIQPYPMGALKGLYPSIKIEP